MEPVDEFESAMRTAFEDRYQRDWNDPAVDEMKGVWAEAWAMALEPAKALLVKALGHITPKPWDDPTMLHARVSEFLGRPVDYADAVAAGRAAG